jgi:hypothetical protein
VLVNPVGADPAEPACQPDSEHERDADRFAVAEALAAGRLYRVGQTD